MGYCTVILLVAATGWLVVRLLWMVPLVVYSMAATVLLTALLAPAVDRVAGRGKHRWAAALAMELALLAVVVTTLLVISRRTMRQFDDLGRRVDEALANVEGFLTRPPLALSEDRIQSVRASLVQAFRGATPDSGTWATIALDVVTAVAIVIFVLFFLLKDGPKMWDWVLSWSPDRRVEAVNELGRSAWSVLTHYVRGMVVVALVDGVLIGASLFAFGVPLALSLSVLVFLGAFVPIAGALITGGLAVGVTGVTVGVWQALVVLAVVLVVQQLEGNVLHPLVIGHAVDLHPVVIVLAVTIGGLVAGIGGAVIAVPLTAVLYRMLAAAIGPDSMVRGDRAHRVRGG